MSKRRFRNKQELQDSWEEYKEYCDSKTITSEVVNSKDLTIAEFEFRKPITYTIEGFCVYSKISRQAFYADYVGKDKYKSITDLMKEECEVDQRQKFEQGLINPKLAGMWMSKYEGYVQKVDQNVEQKNIVSVTFDNPELEKYSV